MPKDAQSIPKPQSNWNPTKYPVNSEDLSFPFAPCPESIRTLYFKYSRHKSSTINQIITSCQYHFEKILWLLYTTGILSLLFPHVAKPIAAIGPPPARYQLPAAAAPLLCPSLQLEMPPPPGWVDDGWRMEGNKIWILLMVQKSGKHLLRLVVYPILYRVKIHHPSWLAGILPSTVPMVKTPTKIKTRWLS